MRLLLAFLLLCGFGSGKSEVSLDESKDGNVVREIIQASAGGGYVVAEFLTDSLVHFDASFTRPYKRSLDQELYHSQMIHKGAQDFTGPRQFAKEDKGDHAEFRTDQLEVTITYVDLHIRVRDLGSNLVLTEFSVGTTDNPTRASSLSMTDEGWVDHVYGLGEHYMRPWGSADGDFYHSQWREAGNGYGNQMMSIEEEGQWRGMAELAQFPMMYAVGRDNNAFGVLLDTVQKVEWFFDRQPFEATTVGKALRFYVFAGNSLPSIRVQYMELVGTAPVPPKSSFGLWQSIFGYRTWEHVDIDVEFLTRPSQPECTFPLDGVALDIYWFGGRMFEESEESAKGSPMGKLHFDDKAFPNPRAKSESLKRESGISLMPISESYVSFGSGMAYSKMSERGFLAKDCESCGTSVLGMGGENHWWGIGGMVDWSNPKGSELWFDCKYCPLIEGCDVDVALCGEMLADTSDPTSQQVNIGGLWLDLGEPEMFHYWAWYYGYNTDDGWLNDHRSIHNIYQLMWAESISGGYKRRKVPSRPFMLTRSGTIGIHRSGVAMWSGDIWPDLRNLANSLQMQQHMSMVGIDYFGSDIGGFERKFFEENEDEKYTQWFANSAWFDVPVRPHAWQPDFSTIETSPARVGDLRSNLFNIRQRYSLLPYLYSLAHRAHQLGEPVFPPIYYYFGKDEKLGGIGNAKMVGRDLLVFVVAGEGQRERDIYLPGGEWINIHTKERYTAPENGKTVAGVSAYLHNPDAHVSPTCSRHDKSTENDCVFTLPAFARAGSIIPRMPVDHAVMNSEGRRKGDGWGHSVTLEVYFPSFDNVPEWARTAEVAHSDMERLSDPHSPLFLRSSVVGIFTLYEDDGSTPQYQNGAVRETRVEATTSHSSFVVDVSPAVGTFDGAEDVLQELEIEAILPVNAAKNVVCVAIGGERIEIVDTREQYAACASDCAWLNAPQVADDEDSQSASCFVKMRDYDVRESSTVEIHHSDSSTVVRMTD